MKVFVVVSSLLAVAAAAPNFLAPRYYAALPATTYIAAPAEVTSQFHAQDGFGQYSYGYNGGLSAKAEAKSLDGVTRGSYSYLDAENKLQTVSYTADAANGFRAEASNLPVAPVETRIAPEPVQDTAEVVQAKAEHMAAVEEAKVRLAEADKVDEQEQSAVVVNAAPIAPITYAAAPIAPITYAAAPVAPITYSAAPIAAPITYAAAPVAAPIALAPASGFSYSSSALHLKNEPLAITTYAAAPVPAAVEVKTPASFSYSTYTQSAPTTVALKTAEIPTAIQYTAAPVPTTYALNYQAPAYTYSYGAPAFYTTSQVAATPITYAAQSLPAALPEPVQDTPEVAQAKAEHLQAVEEVKARNAQ